MKAEDKGVWLSKEAILRKMNEVMDSQDLYLPIHFKALVLDEVAPVDVLDKIRAETEMMKLGESANFCIRAHNNAIDGVLQIIDRHRKEQE